MKLSYVYLAMAIIGAVLPYYQLFQFIAENGWGLMEYIEQLFINDASSMVAIDLLISCVVFWIFLYFEGHRLQIPKLWIYVVIHIFIGLSAALPLFLYARERKSAGKKATYAS
ncbi:MAG: DUF2834 domain-containing protein [Tunicatimonas sp.]|uniref:DUF2834 domain-containing protein n=1 Tax=Tunicatimonas sp. TaxID=1940096 RepID=UPI003C711FFF